VTGKTILLHEGTENTKITKRVWYTALFVHSVFFVTP